MRGLLRVRVMGMRSPSCLSVRVGCEKVRSPHRATAVRFSGAKVEVRVLVVGHPTGLAGVLPPTGGEVEHMVGHVEGSRLVGHEPKDDLALLRVVASKPELTLG